MKRNKLLCVVFALIMILCSCIGCSAEKTAKSIEVTKLPDKVEYELGEEFEADGGEVTATFDDGHKETAELTDPAVKLSTVKTQKSGKKTVTVTYAGRRARFSITVKPIVVSFVLGEGKGTLDPVELRQVGKLTLPNVPTVDGFEFEGWYNDGNFTEPFDATKDITANMTVYANWLDASATYYNLSFDYNYYGSPKSRKQSVEENTVPSKPRDPSRNGYSFDGWYTAPTGGSAFDFNAGITQDTTAYAHWTRTAGDTPVEYVFEAEDLDLDGLQGLGYSNNAEGVGMIMELGDTFGASNGRCVGYTYNKGLQFNFRIVSDRAVSDAKIVARFTGEFKDFTLTPDMFDISLNGESVDYGQIAITGIVNSQIRAFEDYVIKINATLVEGENNISMTVNNNVNWIGGGTVGATAPIIDCIKVTTTAVLWWNGNYKLPMAGNY